MSNTIWLIQTSWAVVASDKRMLLLPIAGVLAAASIFGAMLGTLWLIGFFGRVDISIGGITLYRLLTDSGAAGVRLSDIAIVVAGYLGVLISLTYFNAVLFVVARDRLYGESRGMSGAFRLVNARWPELVGWCCFAYTLGLLIQYIRHSNNLVVKILGLVFGVIWSVSTYFVVPFLVVEQLSPVDAVKRSTILLKDTWGERLTAAFGFGLAFLVLFLVVLIPCLFLALGAPAAFVLLLSLLCLPTFLYGLVVLHTMDQVFQAALFVYATTGKVSASFPDAMIKGAYRSRKGGNSGSDSGGWSGGPPSGHRVDGAYLPQSAIDNRSWALNERYMRP